MDMTMNKPTDALAGPLHRVVLVAFIVAMNGYLLYRIGRIEAAIETLVLVVQSDGQRLSELEDK
jgi:hypothetical protein